VFARAAKYSLFDPAKEMVYIEMDADEKKQGKAAVDLVGSQVRWQHLSSLLWSVTPDCGTDLLHLQYS
jgi:ATP/ADP translocase